MVVRGIPRLVGLPALADYGEGLQVQRERVQADSGGDQTRGRKSPLPGEAGSLHLVHSARWGRVCDMCAWGTQRRLGAQDAQAPSEVADLHEGGRWSVYHSHQQFRHSEPSLSVGGGGTPQIQVSRCQPTASLILVPFRGQWSQPCCDNLLPAPRHTGSVTEGVSATLVEPGEVEPLVRHLSWKRTPPTAMYVSSEVGLSLVESFF